MAYNPFNPTGMERHRVKDLMESSIAAMYFQLEGGNVAGVLTPQHK